MPASAVRRVVITGLGLISPLGNSKEALWEALTNGRSAVRPLESLPGAALPTSCGAEARDFTGHIDDFGPLDKTVKRNIKKGLKMMCREIQMAVAASQRALADARLVAEQYQGERTGAVFGCDYIMTRPEEFTDGVRNCLEPDGRFQFTRWGQQGLTKVDPLWLLKYLPNMPASHVAILNDLRGPNNSITMREASANLAIGEAYLTIARGSADRMLAGATGTRIHPLRTVHVMLQEQVAPDDPVPAAMCRPFDAHRRGSVLGEGAAVLVLEELQSAQARGASILGEIVGYGSSAAVDRRGTPRQEVAVRNVLQQALHTAGLDPQRIGHLHAHGLATRQEDCQEAQAIQSLFGTRDTPVPVTAAKSYFGNLGAAGGLVELMASLLALQHDWLFPVLNYQTPDPDCPLAVCTAAGGSPGHSFLNINFTPQGQASAIAVAGPT